MGGQFKILELADDGGGASTVWLDGFQPRHAGQSLVDAFPAKAFFIDQYLAVEAEGVVSALMLRLKAVTVQPPIGK